MDWVVCRSAVATGLPVKSSIRQKLTARTTHPKRTSIVQTQRVPCNGIRRQSVGLRIRAIMVGDCDVFIVFTSSQQQTQ